MSRAGDLSPQAAWELLDADSVLLDVRTSGEWQHIGVPDLSSRTADVVFIEWNTGDGSTNADFLRQLTEAVPVEKKLLVLCRSGVRSLAAAQLASDAGYTAYNILEGFEGVQDGYGDRVVNGWKNRGLPWK
ncbi:rhodanese-like domain-containing protein [Specibacter sp. NPDC057265]|uniref:rhodanese-like domain-containing protein n=1 Tax=Specibacter sp. NPDC057265 TaxID=3346075 RepID=UPI003633F799